MGSNKYLLGICISEATVKLHILDAARRDHIHVQIGMIRNPLWQLFFYFLFFNYQTCAGHYQKLEQARDSELHCLSVTDGLVCVYIRKILNQSF